MMVAGFMGDDFVVMGLDSDAMCAHIDDEQIMASVKRACECLEAAHHRAQKLSRESETALANALGMGVN